MKLLYVNFFLHYSLRPLYYVRKPAEFAGYHLLRYRILPSDKNESYSIKEVETIRKIIEE